MNTRAAPATAPAWRSRLVDYTLCALAAACGMAGYDWLYREILAMCF
ncbi:hypothetical protein [Zoogloea sp.]